MPQSFVCMNCHLVFSTENRVPLIEPDLAPRFYGYMGGIVDNMGGKLTAAGGMPDHVHLIVSLGRTMSTADTVRTVKTNSSKWIHETFPSMGRFAWQTGYGAFAVSYSNVGQVKRYIDNQQEHHRARTFQEEFRALLEKHNIQYDERYIWD
jgi:REP element-mobilizing transposase RayT